MRSASQPMITSEWAYQQLKRRIIGGLLEPNARLIESDLATEFEVSRTPVREAIKRLTAEGFLQNDPVGGTVVRNVDPRELEEILVVREVLDGLAARLAAPRITPGDISNLDLAMNMMHKSARSADWDGVVCANVKFHDLIQLISGNRRLQHETGALLDLVRHFTRKALANRARAEESLAEHRVIVRALGARNSHEAERAARRHVELARLYLARYMLAQ